MRNERYTSLFADNKTNKVVERQEIRRFTKMSNKIDTTELTEMLENVILMLNQVLKEQDSLSKKIEDISKPIIEPISSIAESSKRKIILNRDASGKITGADDDIIAIKNDVSTFADMEFGNWILDAVNKQWIYYTSGNAEIARFNLFDENGLPSVDSVFERRKV
jgi:hypothetical protein